MLHPASYPQIRPLLESGDVVAFQGQGFLSSAILKCTGSNISHVGIIRRVESDGHVYLIEATTLKKGEPAGVFTSRLSDRVASYEGKMWVLRLSRESRSHFDVQAFENECKQMDGRKYDRLGVADFVLRKWLHLRLNPFPGYVFCSCLVSYALESAGVLPRSIYARNEAPSDVCGFAIYDSEYFQVLGKSEEIRGFNSVAL